MRKLALAAAVGLAALVGQRTAASSITIAPSPMPGPTPGDLFENVSILHISPLYPGFNATDMFGDTASAIEPGDTIYGDWFPNVGTTFNVQFKTAAPVTLGSFALYLADDSSPGSPNPNFRAVNEFILLASDGTLGTNGLPVYNQVLADTTVRYPYRTAYGSSVIRISGDVLPVASAQYFAAVFPSAYAYSGPRVLELDGFAPARATAVPLPPAAGLGTVLLLSVAWARCRIQPPPHRA